MENKSAERVLSRLPEEIRRALKEVGGDVTEIRIRRNRRLAFTLLIRPSGGQGGARTFSQNGESTLFIDDALMNRAIDSLCAHSLYSHNDTINEGYIAISGGYRVGVVGRAVVENGTIKQLSAITSLNIRIPHDVPGVARELFDRLMQSRFQKSILLFSPPNMGKTTLLRDLIVRLSAPPASCKVAVIDTRREIETERLSACQNVDILSGYPKGKGIEIATRTLSPEFLICDEIGSIEEARPLLSAQNCGVPIVATAHAGSVSELLRRESMAMLHQAGLFSEYIGIRKLRPDAPPLLSITAADEVR